MNIDPFANECRLCGAAEGEPCTDQNKRIIDSHAIRLVLAQKHFQKQQLHQYRFYFNLYSNNDNSYYSISSGSTGNLWITNKEKRRKMISTQKVFDAIEKIYKETEGEC
jgi:hypothetical protein